MLINYIRVNKTKDSKGNPIGVIIALDKNHFGWSLCNPKDKWNKELGIAIAKNRAERITENELLSKLKGYPTYKKVEPLLLNVKERAQKYFV